MRSLLSPGAFGRYGEIVSQNWMKSTHYTLRIEGAWLFWSFRCEIPPPFVRVRVRYRPGDRGTELVEFIEEIVLK